MTVEAIRIAEGLDALVAAAAVPTCHRLLAQEAIRLVLVPILSMENPVNIAEGIYKLGQLLGEQTGCYPEADPEYDGDDE